LGAVSSMPFSRLAGRPTMVHEGPVCCLQPFSTIPPVSGQFFIVLFVSIASSLSFIFLSFCRHTSINHCTHFYLLVLLSPWYICTTGALVDIVQKVK
jgi:hypothetical protein